MLTLQIQDRTLEKQLTELLQQKFDGNSEKMLQALMKTYTAQLNRLKYSGILKWEKDGLTFQKEIRCVSGNKILLDTNAFIYFKGDANNDD